MTEDRQTTTSQAQSSCQKERKTSIHDIRNQDLVSRFLAATPPYLYSAPIGPNNFFFSDMLRSLVQARNNENARNLQLQQAAMTRRPRKRSWSQHRPFYDHSIRERKDVVVVEEAKNPSHHPEKPLELTNKQLFPISPKYPKSEQKDQDPTLEQKSSSLTSGHHKTTAHNLEMENQSENSPNDVTLEDSPALNLPPSDLVLPPPPPVWYPPIYPPYGIDPLHFFIDLRVSGHIYDRKKESCSLLADPTENNNNPSHLDSEVEGGGGDARGSIAGKQRLGSAFTVPAPRTDNKTSSAINLSASSNLEKLNNYAKYYHLSDSKENQPNLKNPNYLLQNLPRIYGNQVVSVGGDENKNSYDTDSKTEQDQHEQLPLTDASGGHHQHHHQERERDNNSNHIDVEVLDNVKAVKSPPSSAH